MKRYYTAESVTEGHPDKVCDQIADAILDECLKHDPSSRVACEVLATRGNVFVAGEISSGYEPPVFDVIRKVLGECGYCTDGIEMDTFVHQQSPDIAKSSECIKKNSGTTMEKREETEAGELEIRALWSVMRVMKPHSLCQCLSFWHTGSPVNFRLAEEADISKISFRMGKHR